MPYTKQWAIVRVTTHYTHARAHTHAKQAATTTTTTNESKIMAGKDITIRRSNSFDMIIE